MISLLKMKGVNLQTKETIYYPKWTRVSTVTETQLAKRMARGSTFSVGEVNGVFADGVYRRPGYVQTEGAGQEPAGEETRHERRCQDQRSL